MLLGDIFFRKIWWEVVPVKRSGGRPSEIPHLYKIDARCSVDSLKVFSPCWCEVCYVLSPAPSQDCVAKNLGKCRKNVLDGGQVITVLCSSFCISYDFSLFRLISYLFYSIGISSCFSLSVAAKISYNFRVFFGMSNRLTGFHAS